MRTAPLLALSLTALLLPACSTNASPTPVISASNAKVVGLEPQTSSYQVLHAFVLRGSGSGRLPASGLTDVNGTLYGTTAENGGWGLGTVYRLTTTGATEKLFGFNRADGADPQASLLDVNGTLYGTTVSGGASGYGVVYSITKSGVEKVLYNFKGGSDGALPRGGLVDANGKLYGTTAFGGSSTCYFSSSIRGCGIVFSLTTSGTETAVHSFAGGTDGAVPFAGLIDVSGTLYGTTEYGGSSCYRGQGCGTVFSLSASGSEKVLYSFASGADGAFPLAPVTSVNGKLYGTTSFGGKGCSGCGTVFSVSLSGAEKVLHSFTGGSDGDMPGAGLIDVKGRLYGTTPQGGGGCGSSGCGIVYSIGMTGSETVLHRFAGGSDGARPLAGLVEMKGALYGTTGSGGDGAGCRQGGCGTVYMLSP